MNSQIDRPNLAKARALMAKGRPNLAKAQKMLGEIIEGGNTLDIISVSGQFDDALTENVARQIRRVQASQSRRQHRGIIDLHINSGGGSFTTGIAIAALIRTLRRDGAYVTARVSNFCGSAAMLPLVAADFREASASAQFLIHRVAYSEVIEERYTAPRLRALASELEIADMEYSKLCDRLLRLSASQKAIVAAGKDLFLSPAMALACGVIHRVRY